MATVFRRKHLWRVCGAVALCVGVPGALAQSAPAPTSTARTTQHLNHGASQERFHSRLFVYDLRDGKSHMIYEADAVWEAPNWSPDARYLIANSGGKVYKFVWKLDGTVTAPVPLEIPAAYDCNNDKAISPDGRKLGFPPRCRLTRAHRSLWPTPMAVT